MRKSAWGPAVFLSLYPLIFWGLAALWLVREPPVIVEKPIIVEVERQVVVERIVHDTSDLQERCYSEETYVLMEAWGRLAFVGERVFCGPGLGSLIVGPSFAEWLDKGGTIDEMETVGDDPETILYEYREAKK